VLEIAAAFVRSGGVDVTSMAYSNYAFSSTFVLLEPHLGVRGLGNRISYGEIAGNLAGRQAVVSPIEGPLR
jgi:hypothetical protein